MSLSEVLERGLGLHQAGRLAEAAAVYAEVLAADPGFFDALHLLGVLEAQRGRFGEAERLFVAALEVDPRSAAARSNLGNVLNELGRFDDALNCYEASVALAPGDVQAMNNRGNALSHLTRFNDALASYDAALSLRPDFVEAMNNRGNALLALRRPEAALASYDRALAINQDYPNALNNRGNALLELKRLDEALVAYDKALAVKPDHDQALYNRGNALLGLRRLTDALRNYDRALALTPNQIEALSNRGIALCELRNTQGALASFRKVLCSAPDHLATMNCYGNALKLRGQFTGALARYDRALAIERNCADALGNRGNALSTLGCFEEAIADFSALIKLDQSAPYAEGYLLHAQMNCCEWDDFERSAKKLTEDVRAGRRASIPFAFLSVSGSARDQFLCADTFCRDRYHPLPRPMWTGEKYDHGRIRVAYLSADFRMHPIAYLLAEVFERHDRSRFEAIALSFGPAESTAMRTRLERAFDRFIDVQAMDDSAIARLARELEVDILVDLMGHTRDNRLAIFAHRPAPLSVNFFFPTGAEFIDYTLADPIAVPSAHHQFYREKIISLPEAFLATDSTRAVAERTPPRRELGLPENAFVFCCFNNAYKLNPTMFGVWMRLLRLVEGSVLWLQNINASATANLRRAAARAGVEVGRLIFAPRVESMEEHLARYRQADLFLDTVPFNAQTTAVDALWAGLPVLTCLGTAFVGRVAASVLDAVGLAELITHSLEEYEALALKLARNPEALAAIRVRLANNRNSYPLFNTDRFRRHMESAFVTMWERQQKGESPESFAVPALS